jgi:hypothetical protein
MSLALLMSAAAHAQTTQLNVTVPFEFIAGDTVLPAHQDQVEPLAQSSSANPAEGLSP